MSKTTQNKDEFVKDMEKRVERLEQEFEQLEREAKVARADARARFERMRADFAAKRKELGRRLDDARSAGAAAWRELAAGVEAAWNDMSDAFNRARGELVSSS